MKEFLGIALLVVLIILGVYFRITKNTGNVDQNDSVARPADPRWLMESVMDCYVYL